MKKPKAVNKDLTEFTFLHDYVLVKALRGSGAKGLVKPDSYEDKSEFGEVIATGEGRVLESGEVIPMPVKKGDIIFFGKYTSEATRHLGEDYHLIRAEDVRAKL